MFCSFLQHASLSSAVPDACSSLPGGLAGRSVSSTATGGSEVHSTYTNLSTKGATLKSSPEATASSSTMSAASPQSTISSDESIAGRSELSVDSLSSTSNAFHRMTTASSGDVLSEPSSSPGAVQLEEQEPLLGTGYLAECPPYGSASPSFETLVQASIGIDGDSQFDLQITNDHFGSEPLESAQGEEFEKLQVVGNKIVLGTCDVASDSVSSDITLAEVNGEGNIFHSDVSEAVSSPPPDSNGEEAASQPGDSGFQYESYTCPSPGPEALKSCCICFDEKESSVVKVHRGCTEILCNDCIGVSAGGPGRVLQMMLAVFPLFNNYVICLKMSLPRLEFG